MPKIGEIPMDVDVPSTGVELTFDPSVDVGIIVGDTYTTYAFPVVLNDGKASVLKGGKKLLSAIQAAVGGSNGPVKMRVRCVGRGGLNVAWNVERL